ncbi:unnamed protein product [Durusdinium trenchii]|uniref:Uncharacterized protein n=1 Tax=Durusdinium trenchii TaxID=1381693 RepID=A0ABP0SWH7_9DINO
MSVQEPHCLQTCRLRDDCAAVQYKEDTCRFMVSDGKETFLDGQVLVRLNNCSEQDASLNLTVPGAQYLQGEFGVMNFYQNDASYSRAGSLPERQLVLGRRPNVQRIPESCAKSFWFLLHINSSDFEDSTLINAPEFFGDTIACIDSDVVSKAFKHGQDAFDLRLLPREVESTPLYDQPPALQHGTLALGVPPCEKPSQDLLLGTLSEPGIYSLHPCECFGAAYASVEPVHEDSDAAVPRNPQGYFNNGSVSDQLLFSGPYTCEESASVGHFSHLEMDECQRACVSKSECQFYLFGKTAQTCTLFQSCSYIQDVGLQITNEVYGMSPEFGSYCRIANPEQCWQEIKRRSMLSFTPSNLPSCLFQEQYEACDALQLLLGKQDGPCSRCQYIDASSAFAAVGLKKVPPPEDFPSASQIMVSCNDTSRMFSRLQNGLRWEGPMQGDATFTCVSGEWVGELGPWQYLTNLTCQA